VLSPACNDLFSGGEILLDATAHNQVPIQIQVSPQSIVCQDHHVVWSKLEPSENGSGLALLKRYLSLLFLPSLGAKTYYASTIPSNHTYFICYYLSSTVCTKI
jgi:hypothetical protein